MPIGALLGGLIAQVWSFEAVFVLGGIAIATLFMFRPMLSEEAIAAAERPVASTDGTAA
jgi:hypothetical protein